MIFFLSLGGVLGVRLCELDGGSGGGISNDGVVQDL